MSFARSLCYAALAGTGVPLFVLTLSPLLGHALALQLYLVAATLGYLVAVAPHPRRALAAGALAAGAGLVLLLLPLRLAELAVSLALLIALVRSLSLARHASGPRAAALELGLQAGGLSLAGLLAGPGLLSLCLAVWGYFLVQSLYALVGDGDAAPLVQDPFDEARRRLLALLE